ncbi:MAG: fimbria/pilus outer membrane usher protein, partial [Gemmatimonadales bacterium]
AITYEFDEKALAVRLTASPDLLVPTVVTLQTVRPSGVTYTKDTVAFMNYSFHLQDLRHFSAFTEAGVSVGGNLLFTTLSRNADGSWLRGLTNFTVDDREHMRRWVIGDTFAGGASFGGGLLLGGFSLSRDFGLDPYFIRHPTLGFSTAILTPSTVDIYVNEVLVRREPVPPGPFELRNLPVNTGRGTIRLVIRDAYGREQEITSPYYFSTRVLARGVSEYSYNLGFRREQGGNANWRYGPLAFLARHRRGLTDSLTAGFDFQADGDLVMGGPSVTTRLPFGELELAAAASVAEGGNGAAASLAYSYIGRPVSFGAFIRGLTPRWATLSLRPESDRARVEANAFVGLHASSRLNLSLQLASADFRDRPRTDRVSALSTIRLTSRASLSLSGGRVQERGRPATFEVSAGLTVSLGHNIT